MSSATALLQSSDVESLKSESSSTQFLNVQIQNENLEPSWGNATKFLVSAESKVFHFLRKLGKYNFVCLVESEAIVAKVQTKI